MTDEEFDEKRHDAIVLSVIAVLTVVFLGAVIILYTA